MKTIDDLVEYLLLLYVTQKSTNVQDPDVIPRPFRIEMSKRWLPRE